MTLASANVPWYGQKIYEVYLWSLQRTPERDHPAYATTGRSSARVSIVF